MSADELEDLVRELPLEEPRPGLRTEVLSAVDAALEKETAEPRGVLSRPWPWALAACFLAGLLVTSHLMESRYAERTAAWRPDDAASRGKAAPDEDRGFVRGRALLLALLRGEDRHD